MYYYHNRISSLEKLTMSTLILERLRDALACPVEHPVPMEIFSNFKTFNPSTMEVIGNLSDDEIRLVRLMNELNVEQIRTVAEIQSQTRKIDERSQNSDFVKLRSIEMSFNSVMQILITSTYQRFSKGTGGNYEIASNGTVVRMQTKTPTAH